MPSVPRCFNHALKLKWNLQSVTKKWVSSIANEMKALEGGPPEAIRVEQLKNRSLVLVKGKQATELLQTLVTNDVRILDERNSIYTLFLNSKGKVIHDAIIYKNKENYLIECDISGTQALQMHIKMYKMAKRAIIENVENKIKVWVVFDPNVNPTAAETLSPPRKFNLPEDFGEGITVAPDPRLPHLGIRILTPKAFHLPKYLKSNGMKLMKSKLSIYKGIRYKLGVGEGLDEIPYSMYTAMEVNADFLNGICPDKQYVGQINGDGEGVRKRLMPIIFDSEPASEDHQNNSPIEDVGGRRVTPIGHLRGVQGCYGLGLVALTSKENYVRLGSSFGRMLTPSWWPQQTHRTRKDTRQLGLSHSPSTANCIIK